MKRYLTLTAVLLLATIAVGAAKDRWIKSSYIGNGTVAVSCSNGGSPTGQMAGDVLIVSCGAK